jgi:hypothetical protein
VTAAAWVAGLALLAAGLPAAASAQVHGTATVTVDVLPDIDEAEGTRPVGELRARLFLETDQRIGDHVRLRLGGWADGLVADRSAVPGGSTRDLDALAQPADLFLELTSSRADLRVGASRIAWGRLDEFQPTDVINPLDLTRFVLDGRSEARLPVGLVRGRVFFTPSASLEGVWVPVFRAGAFDQLDEPTSPFNVSAAARAGAGVGALPLTRIEPERRWESSQGGARLAATTGRLDWSASAYRGFRTVPTTTLVAVDGPRLEETFPRFTMVGADAETVRGAWGVRGEVAAFVEDELQSSRLARGVPGRSIEAGVGVDRKAGDYRLAGNVLWSWSAVDEDDPVGALADGDPEVERSRVRLVVAADRRFARETRQLKLFAIYDPDASALFARLIATFTLRDDVWLEAAGSLFTGTSDDLIGRLTRRDVVYLRLRVGF